MARSTTLWRFRRPATTIRPAFFESVNKPDEPQFARSILLNGCDYSGGQIRSVRPRPRAFECRLLEGRSGFEVFEAPGRVRTRYASGSLPRLRWRHFSWPG